MSDYGYRAPRKRTRIPVLLFLILGSFILLYPTYTLLKKSQAYVSPIPENISPNISILNISVPKKRDPEALKQIVKSIMDSESNNYSVLVKDFKSDFEMAIDDKAIYVAASVNKVPIMASLYSKIQNHVVDPEKIITMQPSDIQNYGTGTMRYDPVGTRYSVKTMTRLMMKKSDNTAAYIIANHIVGLKTIQQQVTEWGLTQTDMFENNTSNRDMAVLFQKIFSGEIASVALTEEMKSLLIDSDFENRLPLLIPEGSIVYHKIGTEVGVVHDVGVVENQKSKYYIGILIGDVSDEKKADENIAKTSKAVYDFML